MPLDFSSKGEALDFSTEGEPIGGEGKSAAMKGLEEIQPSAPLEPHPQEETLFGSEALGTIKAGAEAGLSFLTGMGSEILSSFGGMGKEIVKGEFGKGTGEKYKEEISKVITYQPRSETARRYQENIGKVADPLLAGVAGVGHIPGVQFAPKAGKEIPLKEAAISSNKSSFEQFAEATKEPAVKKTPTQSELDLGYPDMFGNRPSDLEQLAKTDTEHEGHTLFSQENIEREAKSRAEMEKRQQASYQAKQKEASGQLEEPLKETPVKPEEAQKVRSSLVKKGQSGAINPELLTLGTARFFEKIGRDPVKLMDAFKGMFNPKEIEKAKLLASNPNSDTTVVLMRPADFQQLARPREDLFRQKGYTFEQAQQAMEQKRQPVREALTKENGVHEIPSLFVRDGKVTSHDGRHRMDVFTEAGMDYVPVFIKSDHKWGAEPPKTETLTSETGDTTVKMPDSIFYPKDRPAQLPEQYQGVTNMHSGINLRQAVDDLLKAHPELADFTNALVQKYGEQARQFAAGMYQEHQQKLGDYAIDTSKKVGEELRKSKNEALLNKQEVVNHYKQAKAEGYKGKIPSEIQDHLDQPGLLSEKNKALHDKYIEPIQKEAQRVFAEIKGLDPEHPGLQDYFGRIAVRGFWKRFFGGIADSSTGGGFTYGNKPSVLKGRSVFQITDPETGEAMVVTQTKDGSVLGWRDKTSFLVSPHETALKPGKEINGRAVEQVKNQRTIEQHTDLKYVDDPLFVASVKLTELQGYLSQLKSLEKIKQSPVWKEMTSKPEDDVPNHVYLKYSDRIPSLRNTKFDPDLAAEFDDFLRPGADNAFTKAVAGLNNIAVKAFMLLPFKHMNNEMQHYITGEGLTGWIPDKIKRESVLQGSTDVLNRTDFYKEVMHTPGAALLSPRTQFDGWTSQMLEHLMNTAKADPKTVQYLKSVGLSPVKFFNAWSSLSSQAMWLTRDGMYMSLVRENAARLEKTGIPHKKAIYDAVHHVNQYMPPYVIPTKVMGSRGLSEIMQNPMLSTFSPYHHGALSAIGTSIKKALAGANPKEHLEGINHLAAYAFMLAVVYPALDKLYQKQTGDEEARARRAGGMHYVAAGLDLASAAYKGESPEKSFEQVSGSVLTPSIVPYSLFQLGINTNIFQKKPIRYAGDTLLGQAYDMASFAQGQMFNPAGITPVLQGKQDMRQWALGQIADVEFPSSGKQARAERIQRHQLKKHRKARGFE